MDELAMHQRRLGAPAWADESDGVMTISTRLGLAVLAQRPMLETLIAGHVQMADSIHAALQVFDEAGDRLTTVALEAAAVSEERCRLLLEAELAI